MGRRRRKVAQIIPHSCPLIFLFQKDTVSQVQDFNLINFTENYNKINSTIITLNILCKLIVTLLNYKHTVTHSEPLKMLCFHV